MMLMLLVSTNVLAVDWVKIVENDAVTGYIDTQSIRRNGNKVRAWTLKNYKSGQVGAANNKIYLSAIIRSEYDCFEDTKRDIDIYAYSGTMGAGDIVFSAPNITKPAISAPPESDIEAVLKMVCVTK